MIIKTLRHWTCYFYSFFLIEPIKLTNKLKITKLKYLNKGIEKIYNKVLGKLKYQFHFFFLNIIDKVDL